MTKKRSFETWIGSNFSKQFCRKIGEDKDLMEMSIKGAAASGTPFVSFFTFEGIVKLAESIGLKKIQTVSTKDMTDRYFKNRADNLVPANGEFFLDART